MAMGNNYNRSSYSGGYSSNRGGGSRNSFNSSGNRGNYAQKELPPEIVPQKIPEDYVDQAEKIMRSLSQGSSVTTSKIRNLLSLVSEIYNKENIRTDKTLLPESMVKINLMRVRVAYECGRDDKVKTFVKQAKLLEYLKGISDDRADLIRFAHYMEALVAYHRYFGGMEG